MEQLCSVFFCAIFDNNFCVIEYVDVVCKMSNGAITPLWLYWKDGRKFLIDKVVDVCPAASTKGGGKGTRFLCQICGQKRYLFFDKNLWWVETN